HYDPSTGLTTGRTEAALPPIDRLRGRVVRSGEAYGVVLDAGANRLVIRGKLPPGAGKWEVLGSYLPLPG
ncbi:MAG TPA: hypothetical protein VFU47_10905, partial [Armatimonadota bacterium]|nr:hypothetical protein [Armatimonadota bacterium]